MRKTRRQRLLGDGLMGRGDKSRFLGPPYYLANDTFTTNRSAGAVNGTRAEPGPGKRAVTDTNSKLSLSGGQAIFATGGAGNGNPRLFLYGLERVPGRVLVAQQTGSTGASTWVGWHTSQNNFPNIAAIRFSPTTTLIYYDNNSQTTVGSYVESTTYRVAVALRSTGAFLFIKGGAYSNWTLLWIASLNSAALLYPGFGSSASGVFTADYLRVPAALWLPAPVASDGFGASFGTTDGLGHAEGIAGGLGSGGNGLTWVDIIGTGWNASGGLYLPGGGMGEEIAFVNTGVADVIASVKFNRSSDNGGVLVRCTADAGSYVKGVHNGTNAQLIKVVGGTPTTLVNAAATYVAGAEIRVICEGQKFRLYYNNALIGTEQTIADASLASGTRQGVVNVDGNNTFDDFTVYNRGTDGSYSILDNF